MSSTSQGWAEKYRPKSIKEIVGQDKIIKEIIKRLNSENMAQNILLTGQTGTGKSTLAKLIAQTIQCEKPITEIDKKTHLTYKAPCQECKSCKAIRNDETTTTFHFFDGSDLNKEKILELKHLCESPNLYGKNRIIYIDELQAVSGGKSTSLEAFLKLIEKVYANNSVYFIMSTMNIKKIPKSVIDRFHMLLKLKPVSSSDLIARTQFILKREGLLENIDFNNLENNTDFLSTFLKEGLPHLASATSGSVREFIQYLETCITRELGTSKEIEEELELMSVDTSSDILIQLISKDFKAFNSLSVIRGELNSFFNLSYNTLNDYYIFTKTKTARLAWQKTKYSIWESKYHNNIIQLMKVYNKIFESSVYYSNNYIMNKLITDYFENEITSKDVSSVVIEGSALVPFEEKVRRRRR